ncbi:MAG: ABC transporter ATP-binding protein, partial [Pseudomonadota bacterium]|nr:ABC transporter ATP-binding protein [Pseudomonadota bacterium]HBQ07078.1 ABC transporter ATP-binding protein [Halomonas sp.]
MNAPLTSSFTSMANVPSLHFQQASFTHRGHALLVPTTLTLSGCQRTLIMGPNGAGKSLFMRLAHGLLRPSSGHVSWEGAPPV